MDELEKKSTSLIKYLERFYENRLLLALGFSAFLILLAIVQLRVPSVVKQQEKLHAISHLYSHWDKDPLNPDYEKKLDMALHDDPELISAYAPSIAQKYLLLHEPKRAAIFGTKAVRALKKELPEFGLFSETSLSIAKGLYVEALAAAKELQTRLSPDRAPALYSINLMRISYLEKITGSRDGEKEAIANIEALLQKKGKHSLNQIFTQGEAAISDYLEHRKKRLY